MGITVFVVCAIAGGIGTALWDRPYPSWQALLVGVYFLFAIKVAPQWEKVALLRFGRYMGLRGPGIFTIIPVVDTLSRYVDQRVRVTKVTAETALTRDTVPVNVDAIVFWVVWNVGKVDPGSGEFYRRHHHERPDGFARIHWTPRTGADDHRARNPGPRVAAHPG